MRFPRITLCAGALLLIAAQHAPKPPARKAKPAAEQTEPAEAAAASTEPAASSGGPGAPEAAASDAAAESTAAPGKPAAPPSEAAEASAAPAAPPSEAAPEIAIPAKGAPPTREFMVGVWTEDLAKCSSALEFKADGTLIGPFPRWELADDGMLTMVGNRQKIWLTVVNNNTMHSRRSETDPPRTLKRCPPAPHSP